MHVAQSTIHEQLKVCKHIALAFTLERNYGCYYYYYYK